MSETKTVIDTGELVSADTTVTVLRFWRDQFPTENYTLAFNSQIGRCLDSRCLNFQLKLDHALAA